MQYPLVFTKNTRGTGIHLSGINKQLTAPLGPWKGDVSIPREIFEREFAANKLQNLKNKNVVVEKNYKKKTWFYFVSGVAIFIATLIYNVM